ncbi:MAG: polyphosphate kinase 2, partial [Deltaproteobacteria bacterium]
MKKLKNGEYTAALRPLQVELAKLQSWIRVTQQRIVVIFEGRD